MEFDTPIPPQFQFLAGTLLEISQERSPEQLLQKVARRALEMPSSAIAVIWLMDSAQRDVTGVSRPQSADPTRYLYAVAGGANTISGLTPQPTRLPDHLARIGLGVGPIGRIATTRQPLRINDLDMEPGELAFAADWLKAEQVRAFAGTPIIYKDEVFGVLGAFGHANMPSDAIWWERVFADHIAAAIANARAFEEIRVAGRRLEEANQRLGRELAERKEAEEKLRQSEQRYRRIVDTASEGVWELDEHFATTYVNRRLAEMLAYEAQEMVGRKLHEFLFEDDQAEMSARIAARRQGLTERYEQRYRRKDGSTVWMYVSATSVRDAEQGFMGSFAMLTDITERKRAEEALLRLNRELRAISNCNQVLLGATDEQTLLQEICRIACQEAGYRMAWVGYAEHDEAKSVRPVAWTGAEEETLANLGITWADTELGRGPGGTAIRIGRTACIEDYATDPLAAPWKEVALQHGFRSAVALPLKDEQANTFGSLNIYSVQPSAFTSEEIRLLEELAGDLAFGIVALRSRAARKRAEETLRESETRLRTIWDHAMDAFFLHDEQLTLLDVNRQACQSLGYSREELIGMHPRDFDIGLGEVDEASVWRVAKPFGDRETVIFESVHRRKDGTTFPVEIRARWIELGGHRLHLSLARDITERKRAEEELRKHREYLEDLVKQRTQRTAELQASNQALRESEEQARRAFEEIQRLKAQLEQQNAYLREEVVEAKAWGDLVGQSAALGQIVSQIDLVAPTDASVLILGETGTGKELIAHEIHHRSQRRDKPLVRVNCASIPKDLYESEFFGHAKGAFTGAIKDRAGRFETAEGGTLFLDEIAEVPLELQSKLLRVLQEKRYERVGEDRTRQADVRIIAATNRDLKKDVDAGRFREDLYYRLNVFPIQIAPLRERKEDIPLLAQHFAQRSVKDLRCPKARLTRAGVVRLQSYDWPGNVRELQNVIERAVILARGGVLDFDLPVRDAPPDTRPQAEHTEDQEPGFLTEPEMRQRERENLLAILEKAEWKVRGRGGAAELLGVNATTLQSRMKAMGIKRPE